jgi:hypothetical protein
VKRRRSLTHVGGEVYVSGNRDVTQALAKALAVAPPDGRSPTLPEPGRNLDGGDEADRAHVHGFHSYPARMHPAVAAGLVAAFSASGATVLDPFCGSGTVLVEAMIAGRRAVGTDLNPLAVRLAQMKTAPLGGPVRDEMVTAAREIAAFADDRRARRAGATRRYPPEDVAAFDPHVLLELDSIRAGVEGLRKDPRVKECLWLVLSAILVKMSRKASDTSSAVAPRRIGAGFAARLFARKTEELARRLAELEGLLPPDARPAKVALDDATRLRSVGASTVDAVITSPPYAATYDYVAHHALRMRWLGIDPRSMGGELGSRRRYARLDPREAREVWSHELGSALRALSRVCRKGARAVLLMADSAVGGEAMRADAMVEGVAPAAGFVLLGRASQRRPHFHEPSAGAFAKSPRAEHAIALEKG